MTNRSSDTTVSIWQAAELQKEKQGCKFLRQRKRSYLLPVAVDVEQSSHLASNDLAMASNCYPPSDHKNEPTAANFYFKCSGMLRSRWYRSVDAVGKW